MRFSVVGPALSPLARGFLSFFFRGVVPLRALLCLSGAARQGEHPTRDFRFATRVSSPRPENYSARRPVVSPCFDPYRAMRGGEPGTLPGEPFRPALGVCWSGIRWTDPATRSMLSGWESTLWLLDSTQPTGRPQFHNSCVSSAGCALPNSRCNWSEFRSRFHEAHRDTSTPRDVCASFVGDAGALRLREFAPPVRAASVLSASSIASRNAGKNQRCTAERAAAALRGAEEPRRSCWHVAILVEHEADARGARWAFPSRLAATARARAAARHRACRLARARGAGQVT